MYEETKSSIDWKGLFLKVVIVFLVVLIAFKGYSILKGKDTKNDTITSTQTVADKKNSKTFTENMEKLRTAGETYFEQNEDKLPTEEGNTSMVTLNDLIKSGVINSLSDEDGKICDVESSYVTAKLENGTTKLKANLVCGNSSSYTQVKLGENDKTTTTSSSSNGTNNYSSTTTTTTGGSSNTTTSSSNGCSTSTCTPSVSVTTNTTVSQNVNTGSTNTSSNKGSSSSNITTTTNKNKYYIVSFDSNGGTIDYDNERVKYYNTVAYPGANQKRGCSFKGWYYNGSQYDFSTPVTKDITLTAKYSCSDYYYDDDDDYYYYDDEDELVTRTMTTTVYTMGWDVYGTDSITINHTLRLPEDLEDEDVKKVRIKKIQYSGPINTLSRANTYANKHSETFIYSPNGWEATNDNSASNLSTINSSAVTFYYNTGYKTLNNASRYGFDVTWSANRVAKQCTRTFSVNGVDNLCDYGIYYKVTWEYQIYR